MNTDDAVEIIFSSPQYRELMEALEEAKKQLSPDERRNRLRARGWVKRFGRNFINQTPP